jgi:DNA-binding transcriptional MerR regulator
MFRIGEFSKLTQVSIRMLRYYDEEGLLRPARIDPFTHYRLYAADQIPALNRILFLRDLGFTVSEIGAAVSPWNEEAIAALLVKRRAEIESTIQAEQEKLASIDRAQRDIRQETLAIHYNVVIKSIPACHVFSLRRVVADYYAEGQLWKEMSTFARENSIPVSSDTFTIYHDAEYKEKDVDIEVCAPVTRMGQDGRGFTYRSMDPVPVMASTMVHGPFERIKDAYLAFAGWLEEHSQYQMAGQSRQIVHRGPWNESDPNKFLTEMQIPLDPHTM